MIQQLKKNKSRLIMFKVLLRVLNQSRGKQDELSF